jgi:hypothetical protein
MPLPLLLILSLSKDARFSCSDSSTEMTDLARRTRYGRRAAQVIPQLGTVRFMMISSLQPPANS